MPADFWLKAGLALLFSGGTVAFAACALAGLFDAEKRLGMRLFFAAIMAQFSGGCAALAIAFVMWTGL